MYISRFIAWLARCSAVSEFNWFCMVRSSGADSPKLISRSSSELRMLMEMSKFTARLSCPSEETLARTVSTAVMLNAGSAMFPIHST